MNAPSRRDTAASLVKFLTAVPVSLGLPALDAALSASSSSSNGGGSSSNIYSRNASASVYGGPTQGLAEQGQDAEEMPFPSPSLSLTANTPRTAATAAGLSSQDVVLVAISSSSESSELESRGRGPVLAAARWMHACVAAQLAAGGVVVYATAPGARSLDHDALRTVLVAMLRHSSSATTEEEEDASDVESRCAVALSGLCEVTCESITDLYVFCSLYEPPPPRAATAGSASSGAGTRTPLAVLDGCLGRYSYVAQWERAAGREVPLVHWALCLLQRRLKCALVLPESGARDRGVDGGHLGSAAASDPAETFTRFSDLARRLAVPHPSPSANADVASPGSSRGGGYCVGGGPVSGGVDRHSGSGGTGRQRGLSDYGTAVRYPNRFFLLWFSPQIQSPPHGSTERQRMTYSAVARLARWRPPTSASAPGSSYGSTPAYAYSRHSTPGADQRSSFQFDWVGETPLW